MEVKHRILYLMQILEKYTDEDHPLSTNQLIDMLKNNYGLSAHRTTISKDIKALQDFGLDIIVVNSTQCKYFIGERKFELPELKLLVDAIESSRFITKKKSESLIEKIHTLASENQTFMLKRNNYVVDGIKPDNEQIYYIVDIINEAINENKKISFQYNEYNRFKEKVLKNDGEFYTISPYNLVWNTDYYYVVGHSEKHDKIVTFRVDRISAPPKISSACRCPKPVDFNISDYSKSVFQMYDGEKVKVELLCDNSLMKTVIDRFGENVQTFENDNDTFITVTEVSVSSTFFGWVFGFDGNMKILAPNNVKEMYTKMITKAYESIK